MSKKRNTDIPPYTNAIDTAAKMQRYITQAQESIVGDTHDRDDAIYAAYGSGRSIREIARYIGISHTQVKNIVDRCVATNLAPHPDLRVETPETMVEGPHFVDTTVAGEVWDTPRDVVSGSAVPIRL